jgi:DNA/RNA-binding domain of Phe-tRNA-synthetase-like protein
LRLTLTPAFLELFPDAVVGIAAGRDLDNAGADPEIAGRLVKATASAAAAFRGVAIADHPRVAVWREAYRRFGAKPKDHPSSIENLVRRAAKGGEIRSINRLVDLYNAISLERLLPAGAEDLDAIEGDVELTLAGDGETPVRLLGEPEERAPRRGEVIYRDGVGAICRRWNWKEADRTKITEGTRRAIAVVEGLPPVPRADVAAAVEEIARGMRERLGGAAEIAILDRAAPAIAL